MASARRVLVFAAALVVTSTAFATAASAAEVNGVACVSPDTVGVRYGPAGTTCAPGEIQILLGRSPAPAIPGPAGPAGAPGASLTSLDDLNGKPCDAASGNPGTTVISYEPGTGYDAPTAHVYCQKGPIVLTLEVRSGPVPAGGTVRIEPSGQDCTLQTPSGTFGGGPTTCAVQFDAPTTVTLTATPDSVSSLDSFPAGCAEATGAVCTLSLTHSSGFTVSFIRSAPLYY